MERPYHVVGQSLHLNQISFVVRDCGSEVRQRGDRFPWARNPCRVWRKLQITIGIGIADFVVEFRDLESVTRFASRHLNPHH